MKNLVILVAGLPEDMGARGECVPVERTPLVSGVVSDRYDIFYGASLSLASAS